MANNEEPEREIDGPKFMNNKDVSSALPKIISFDELARCGEEIWIENRGDLYRLRRTKQGKLILTK
ncbi:MAG: hemin uptake protein HemP [Planctomycetota bacterium]